MTKMLIFVRIVQSPFRMSYCGYAVFYVDSIYKRKNKWSIQNKIRGVRKHFLALTCFAQARIMMIY